jgi:hypothetical protein
MGLHGKKDKSAPYHLAAAMQSGLKDSQMRTFPGGHVFFLLRQKQCIEARVDFFGFVQTSCEPCSPTRFSTKNGRICEPLGNALSPSARRAARSNVFIDASSCFGFGSSSNKESLTSLCLNFSRLKRGALEIRVAPGRWR